MGLDMYLNADIFLWNEEGDKIKQAITEINPFGLGNCDLMKIQFQLGYWRKANAIHNWFVENVQEGKDDCQSYYVTTEQLQVLKEECEKVLAKPSLGKKRLPTKKGFFFGDTEYDEYYLNDLQDTVNIINKVLNNPDHKKLLIYYKSSW